MTVDPRCSRCRFWDKLNDPKYPQIGYLCLSDDVVSLHMQPEPHPDFGCRFFKEKAMKKAEINQALNFQRLWDVVVFEEDGYLLFTFRDAVARGEDYIGYATNGNARTRIDRSSRWGQEIVKAYEEGA